MADYQRALAAGDVDAIVATFEPDGYAREPAGGRMSTPAATLSAPSERQFSNGGGIPLEHCLLINDKRAGALEFNVVQWGKTELPPQAGVVVHVRGQAASWRRFASSTTSNRRSVKAASWDEDESYERGELGHDVRR